MLAVNITTNRVKETSATGGQESSRELGVQARAARWWTIADSTLRDYAVEIVAVEHNVIVGVFTVREWQRDPPPTTRSSSSWPRPWTGSG